MLNFRKISYTLLLIIFFAALASSVYFILKTLHYTPTLQEAEATEKASYHFVLISEEVGNPYWSRVKQGAMDAGSIYDVAIEYNGPVQSSTELHVKAVEKAIASKVDGIITQGLDEAKITPVINKAIQKGIPVITIDTDAPHSRRRAYIGTNNYRAGYLAGKTLIQDTNGKINVGIITGSFHSASQKQRVAGFRDAVSNTPRVEIVAIKSSNISRIQAAEKTYEIFSEQDVNAFYGTSALDGFGIAAVVQHLNKTDEVYILAFDALPETLKLIKKDVIEATVVQKPYQMGYESVRLMVKLKHGQEIPEIHYSGTQVIQKDDLPLQQVVNTAGSGHE